MSKKTLSNQQSAVSGGGLHQSLLLPGLLPGNEQHRARGWLEWVQSTILSQNHNNTMRPNPTLAPNRTLTNSGSSAIRSSLSLAAASRLAMLLLGDLALISLRPAVQPLAALLLCS